MYISKIAFANYSFKANKVNNNAKSKTVFDISQLDPRLNNLVSAGNISPKDVKNITKIINNNSDGSIALIKYKDGREKSFYSTGILKSEKSKYGDYIEYDKDGVKTSSESRNGTCTKYYKSGSVASERYRDGTYRTFYEDGHLHENWPASGLPIFYYPNGKVESEKLIDGSWSNYDKDGNLSSIITSGGIEHKIKKQ